MISPASQTALSGLDVARQRLDQSASNVANVSTDGYEAQRVIPQEQVAPEREGVSVGNGVEGVVEPTGAPAPVAFDGEVERLLSNTDLISETTEQLGASQAFQANLAVLRSEDDLTESLLDVTA